MLHGQFVRQNKKARNLKRLKWLKNGSLTRDRESLACTAQLQRLWTNAIKGTIDKCQEEMRPMICGKSDESIYHIETEYNKLIQEDYKRRYDWIGWRISWEIFEVKGNPVPIKWCKHL